MRAPVKLGEPKATFSQESLEDRETGNIPVSETVSLSPEDPRSPEQSLKYCKLFSEGGCSEEREFSFLSDVLPEDKELRKQLQMDTLELVIRVQEEERRSHSHCLWSRDPYWPLIVQDRHFVNAKVQI